MASTPEDRSLGELFADLARETGALVRQELRQAGAEVSERVAEVGKEGGVFAVGAVLLHAAFLTLVAAVVLALGQLGFPWWLAALIVGIVLGVIGSVVLSRAGAALKRADLLPRRAMKTLKEDQEWVKEQIG